jgi:hypothetical protein
MDRNVYAMDSENASFYTAQDDRVEAVEDWKQLNNIDNNPDGIGPVKDPFDEFERKYIYLKLVSVAAA